MCLSSHLRSHQSCFTFSDLCCHLFHFLRRNMASEPVCRDRGLEFPYQAWVAFRESPLLFVSPLSIHTNCCSIEYLCWHRWIDFLPGSTFWFINISMSRTSIYQTLEHVLTPSYWILRCHLYSSSLRHWVSQWMHSRTLLNIRILIICWHSVVQTNHAVISRSKIEKVVREPWQLSSLLFENWIWMLLLNNSDFGS